MMNEFLQQQPGAMPAPVEAAWNMDALRQAMPPASHFPADPAWAAEFEPGMQQSAPLRTAPGAGFNSAEFAAYMRQASVPGNASASTATMMPAAGMMGYRPMGMGMMGMAHGYQPAFAPMQQQQYQPMPQQDVKGKGRLVELDDTEWQRQFEALEQGDRDIDAEANAAIEAELAQQTERSVPEGEEQLESETDNFGDFEAIWRGIQAETKIARQLAEDELLEQGASATSAGFELDDWNEFELNSHLAEAPSLGEYMFEQDNPFASAETLDPFAEGVEIMDGGGNLSLAALAFEAAARRDPARVEAWVRLGAAQAQNEKEVPSIRALEAALRQDPNCLEALMALAVSYTNEGYETSAYRTLERWVAVKYPGVGAPPAQSDGEQLGFTGRAELRGKVTEMFIRAAQLSPSGESMDPDVQVGLGVLFYAAEEYDKAIDCFEAALASTEAGVANARRNLHLLWNRLGATMANGGRSEEAIQAYERALAIRPNFVRARYNLGVSCINMGVLPEAAGHLLGALEMHRVDEDEGKAKARAIVDGEGTGAGGSVSEQDIDRLLTQNESTNLYDTLRRVFNLMGRRDLSDRVRLGMDPRQFREEFDF
jgi:peroxin-5